MQDIDKRGLRGDAGTQRLGQLLAHDVAVAGLDVLPLAVVAVLPDQLMELVLGELSGRSRERRIGPDDVGDDVLGNGKAELACVDVEGGEADQAGKRARFHAEDLGLLGREAAAEPARDGLHLVLVGLPEFVGRDLCLADGGDRALARAAHDVADAPDGERDDQQRQQELREDVRDASPHLVEHDDFPGYCRAALRRCMPSYRRPRGSPDFSAPNGGAHGHIMDSVSGQREALTGGALMASKSGIRPLVAGNWKMNGLAASLGEARRVRERLGEADFAPGVDVMICPPATLIGALARDAAGSRLLVGGQDCHRSASGAHTGDISAEMLKDAGAGAVIVGHSERRADHGERSGDVQAKALAAHRAGLTAIVCIGETAGERKAGLTLAVVTRQLGASLPDTARAADTVVAYEPVWAIGTGLTPRWPTWPRCTAICAAHSWSASARRSPHAHSLRRLGEARQRARADGALPTSMAALVGGASLKADDFLAIVAACAT